MRKSKSPTEKALEQGLENFVADGIRDIMRDIKPVRRKHHSVEANELARLTQIAIHEFTEVEREHIGPHPLGGRDEEREELARAILSFASYGLTLDGAGYDDREQWL